MYTTTIYAKRIQQIKIQNNNCNIQSIKLHKMLLEELLTGNKCLNKVKQFKNLYTF